MSTSSRQEAMEGEPVRRHVSDAVLRYNKPVYGMFIAIKIDTNTAETFRHGIWYTKDDIVQRLDIVPLTLEQFQRYFVAMFEADAAKPENLRDLLLRCETMRELLDAPSWKRHIDISVSERALEIRNGTENAIVNDAPFIPMGAKVHHNVFGDGQVVAIMASFPDCQARVIELPYLMALPDEITINPDGNTLHHDSFGDGAIIAFTIVFQKQIIRLPYPAQFIDGALKVAI